MGNKILGRRSRNFYRGFNDRQIDYLKQKFETLSKDKALDKQLFKEAYQMGEEVYRAFMEEADFDHEGGIDEYEFICMVSHLCNQTTDELGSQLFRMLTGGKKSLSKDDLLPFTSMCLKYNAYLEKKAVAEKDVAKANLNKFRKYDFDKSKSIEEEEFCKICRKDQDYKTWLFNMGLITKNQMDYHDQIYDLVDSDVGEEVERHLSHTNPNIDRVKRGVEHRMQGDDEFQMEEVVGDQFTPVEMPWKKETVGFGEKDFGEKIFEGAPLSFLNLEYVLGYRSYDCRNNLKFDSRDRIIYHQAALGIVMDERHNRKANQPEYNQYFINEHKDDISCLDIAGDTVATGEVGTKPVIILWDTNPAEGSVKSEFIVSKELTQSVGTVCLSPQKDFLAATCNDEDHKLVVYNLNELKQIEKDLTSPKTGIVCSGPLTKSLVFDIKFTIDRQSIVAVTVKEILFITFQNNIVNSSRGEFGNFSPTMALCLLAIRGEHGGQRKDLMLTGMGNGSVYFWDKDHCVKAVVGHSGSVSTICARSDVESFISGDKSGKIIIWDAHFKKERQVVVPKTNCPSNMIVSLAHNSKRQLLIGTKASNIYLLRHTDPIDKAKTVMSGHCDGTLWATAIHKTEPFLYTGGDDQRILKWDYKTNRKVVAEMKTPYKIRSMDFNNYNKMLVVGFVNGVIQCYQSDNLAKIDKLSYSKIKNPDKQVLNIVKFDHYGQFIVAAYSHPKTRVAIMQVAQDSLKPPTFIDFKDDKIVAFDLSKANKNKNQAKFMRVYTEKGHYQVYEISKEKPTKVEKGDKKYLKMDWDNHTVTFSPQTRGLLTEGVTEDDISCCALAPRYKNAVVVGDKFSKLKLFNYPNNQNNQIYSKYEGHSNTVTAIQFDYDENYLISVGGQEKSILVWKYNNQAFLEKYQYFYEQMAEESDQEVKDKRKVDPDDQFEDEQIVGEQAGATNQYKGQIKTPSDFEPNPRKDNQPPKETISIHHVFGVRNKYLNDEVRNQCRFSHDKQHALFPTACMALKTHISSRQQEVFLEHREDIVSFAVDKDRKLMATGQMAEKNLKNPRKKILAIYVWDIEHKKMLQKLDGFHTIAIILLEFSPSGRHLFTCGDDDKHTFAVYDWRSGTVLYSGPVSRGKVNGIAWKSETQFMTCGLDHVKLWEKNKGRMGKFNSSSKTEGQVCCTKSNNIYITGGTHGNLYNWTGNMASKPISAHNGQKVHCLVEKKYEVYSGGGDGSIYRWKKAANGSISGQANLFISLNSAYQQLMREVKPFPEEFGVLSLDFAGQGDECLVATKGCCIFHYKGQRFKLVQQGHYKGQLWGLACSPHQDVFITGGDDKTVRQWDIKSKKQVTRVYQEEKIRGLDWSNDGEKIVVADNDARIFLFDEKLKLKDQWKGKPFAENQKAPKGKKGSDGWVQEIKFSPDSEMIAYGTHGRSIYMEFIRVKGDKIILHKVAKSGTSALLHIDWSKQGDAISLNTQAAQLLFVSTEGTNPSASSMKDQKWATWTQKFGFPVQGIFQGPDYSDINTVCRSKFGTFLAAGYDDQLIRLFKYPAYIPKQSFTAYAGHSSHVTRIRFTPNYMVSLGGEDKTVIIWEIHGQEKVKAKADDGEDSDGLDDLDDDVDIPNRIMERRVKPKKEEEFYQAADEGDEFMAVKPWLGAIKQPTYQYPKQTKHKPKASLKLQFVHGYRTKDCRQNLFFIDKNTLLYHAAAVLIYHNISEKPSQQTLLTDHDDDILSIDYHKDSGTVLTGELGPKPLVNYYRNAQLVHTFKAPVIKGVLAIAISPDGSMAVCAGMDDDHYIAVLDLHKNTVLTKQKGGKKVILKMGWVNDNSFVGIGINNFKMWTYANGTVKAKDSRTRGNFVSLAIGKNKVLTGQSSGKIHSWTGTESKLVKQLKVTKQVNKQREQVATSVVESLVIHDNYIAAGTKDGYVFLLDHSYMTISIFSLVDKLKEFHLVSEHPSVRSIDFLGDKMLIGTFGSEIFEVTLGPVGKAQNTKDVPETIIKKITCHLKCHYSPNNSWTNEVWGLTVSDDQVFSCSDDATLRCWSIKERRMLSIASLNMVQNPDKAKAKKMPFISVQKDKKTRDFVDSSKGRSVAISPDRKFVVVGCKDGRVKIFKYNQDNHEMTLKVTFKHAKEWISDIKFGYNMLLVGSHDNAIYAYDYDPETEQFKRKYRPMKKHSSYITHIDVSRDSCYLQSTCGAYELLFWDLNTGKQITSGATMLRDERWASWTANLGWPVQGIYPKCTDGTFIHSVERSNTSLNRTLMKDDPQTPYLLAAGNNNGKVCLYNYPCTIKNSDHVQGKGHSSHITNVRWQKDDEYVISVGGQDQCVMYWSVAKNR